MFVNFPIKPNRALQFAPAPPPPASDWQETQLRPRPGWETAQRQTRQYVGGKKNNSEAIETSSLDLRIVYLRFERIFASRQEH